MILSYKGKNSNQLIFSDISGFENWLSLKYSLLGDPSLAFSVPNHLYVDSSVGFLLVRLWLCGSPAESRIQQ